MENQTVSGIVRVEGPWRVVPDGMPPEKACELLFRGALGDFERKNLPAPQDTDLSQGGA